MFDTKIDEDLKPLIPRNNTTTMHTIAQTTLSAISITEQRESNRLNAKLNISINNLEKTIKDQDLKNGKLQSKLFWLTVATVLLAVVQVITTFLG